MIPPMSSLSHSAVKIVRFCKAQIKDYTNEEVGKMRSSSFPACCAEILLSSKFLSSSTNSNHWKSSNFIRHHLRSSANSSKYWELVVQKPIPQSWFRKHPQTPQKEYNKTNVKISVIKYLFQTNAICLPTESQRIIKAVLMAIAGLQKNKKRFGIWFELFFRE
jgi:hypothetical protein